MSNRNPTATTRPTGHGKVIEHAASLLIAHSHTALRLSLGLVFLAFGSLKFVPGLSPAEGLAVATIERLTLGLVSGEAALLLTAVTETVIGLTLLSGRFLRLGLVLLAGALVGIMSPLVLFAGDLYLDDGPTLAAQYVFKDLVLAAAGLAVAARSLGGRLSREE